MSLLNVILRTCSVLIESHYLYHRMITFSDTYIFYICERSTEKYFHSSVRRYLFLHRPSIINTNNVITFISMLWHVLLGCNAGRIDTCVMYNCDDVTYAVLQRSQVRAIHILGIDSVMVYIIQIVLIRDNNPKQTRLLLVEFLHLSNRSSVHVLCMCSVYQIRQHSP